MLLLYRTRKPKLGQTTEVINQFLKNSLRGAIPALLPPAPSSTQGLSLSTYKVAASRLVPMHCGKGPPSFRYFK